MALSEEEKIKLVSRAFLIYQNLISLLIILGGDGYEPSEETMLSSAQVSLIAAKAFNTAVYTEGFFDVVETE